MNKIIKINKKYNNSFNFLLKKFFKCNITNFKEDTQYYAIFREKIENWNDINELEDKIISLGRTCFNFYKWKHTQDIPSNIIINKNFVFFTGIYTKQKYRNQGYGKKLLLFRLEEVKNYNIFSDVRKDSFLLKIYLENNFKIINECPDKLSFCMIKYK